MVALLTTSLQLISVFGFIWLGTRSKGRKNATFRCPSNIWNILLFFILAHFTENALIKKIPNHYDRVGISYQTSNDFSSKMRTHLQEKFTEAKSSMDHTTHDLSSLHIAYETLINSTRRHNYNAYGDLIADGKIPLESPYIFEGGVIVSSIMTNLFHYIMCYLLASPKRFQSARLHMGVLCLIQFLVEFQLRFLSDHGQHFLDTILNYFKIAPFEFIELLRRLVPVAFAILLHLSSKYYREKFENIERLLQANLKTSSIIFERLMTLKNEGAKASSNQEKLEKAKSTKKESNDEASTVEESTDESRTKSSKAGSSLGTAERSSTILGLRPAHFILLVVLLAYKIYTRTTRSKTLTSS